MTPRPALKLKHSRPLSAVWIGSSASTSANNSGNSDLGQSQQPSSSSSFIHDNTPPGLPDLPEPPSPSSSIGSRGSGLPSPPATNSTGSESTGDAGSIAVRQRPLSYTSNSSASTSSGSHKTTPSVSLKGSNNMMDMGSRLVDERQPEGVAGHEDFDDDNDNDLEGDDTERLDRRHSVKSSSENVLALQRVKSLTERNRMVRRLFYVTSQWLTFLLLLILTHICAFFAMLGP